jgi:hypothetical protein
MHGLTQEGYRPVNYSLRVKRIAASFLKQKVGEKAYIE